MVCSKALLQGALAPHLHRPARTVSSLGAFQTAGCRPGSLSRQSPPALPPAATAAAAAAQRLRLRCASLPRRAAEKAVEALKEEHAPLTDREVAAAAAAALVATSSTMAHSKSAIGYLAEEAPLRTWLPLLLCAAAAACGFATARRQLVWAAAGGVATFAVCIWQVVAPLVRRFQTLRTRLIEADYAAKERLDAAAEQLRKATGERSEAKQEAQQAKQEAQQAKQKAQQAKQEAQQVQQEAEKAQRQVAQLRQQAEQVEQATSLASVAGREHTDDSAVSALQATERQAQLERQLDERQQREQRLAGILNNALNAAAVPHQGAGGEGCADVSSEDLQGDGYDERPVDRSDAEDLAAALQQRVVVLRHQAQQAASEHEEVAALNAELRAHGDSLAAMQAQLQMAKADARRLPQLQQYARDLEWQLLQEQQARQALLEKEGARAGAEAAQSMIAAAPAADDAAGAEAAQSMPAAAPAADNAQHAAAAGEHASTAEDHAAAAGASELNQAVTAPPHRRRGWPLGSGKRPAGASGAEDMAAEVATLKAELAKAKGHLEALRQDGTHAGTLE